MRQQVNFFQPRFRERRTPLPSVLLFKVSAATFVAMLLIYAFAASRVAGVDTEMQVIAAQEAAALERLENLRSSIEQVLGEQSWADRLEEASELLRDREESLALVSGTELGNDSGFSEHLRALARQSMNGLWLTRISLSAEGDQTWLEGESLEPDFVPVYLQGLADEPAFASQRFHRLNIDRDEEGDGERLTFAVTSDASFDGRELVTR